MGREKVSQKLRTARICTDLNGVISNSFFVSLFLPGFEIRRDSFVPAAHLRVSSDVFH